MSEFMENIKVCQEADGFLVQNGFKREAESFTAGIMQRYWRNNTRVVLECTDNTHKVLRASIFAHTSGVSFPMNMDSLRHYSQRFLGVPKKA